MNFFGGARTAGVLARYSGLDRGVRLNFKQPYFFSPRYRFGAAAGSTWHNDEPALHARHRRRPRDRSRAQFGRAGGAGARIAAGDDAVADLRERVGGLRRSPKSALNDPTFRDELIALGLDPRSGTRQRPAVGAQPRRRPQHHRQPARRASAGYFAAMHLEQAGKWLGGDYDYYEVTGEARYYLSIGDRPWSPLRARAGDRSTRSAPSRTPRAVLQALLPRRRDEPARVGPLRSGAAERRGPADRRPHVRELLDRAARADLGQTWRRDLPRRRQRLDRTRGTST